MNLKNKTIIHLNQLKDKKISSIEDFVSSREYKINKIHLLANVKIPSYLDDSHLDLMIEVAELYDIPYYVYFRHIQKESSFRINALSPEGAQSFGQVMPVTFNEWCTYTGLDKNNPTTNIIVSGMILKKLYIELKSWRLAIAAYNCGLKRVRDCKCVPNIKETQSHVNFIFN